MVRHRVLPLAAALLALAGPLGAAPGEAPPGPADALRRALAEAEAALAAAEPELAESRYRTALVEGWLVEGALELAAGDLAAARAALVHASTSSIEVRRPLVALAGVQIRLGEAAEAVAGLRTVVARSPSDMGTRLLLAQALVAAGHPEHAVGELEEARAMAPADPELAYALASGYLGVGRVERAEPLFAELAAARPSARTHVLIGRTFRDFGHHERARNELRKALALDPNARRAHYYLGTLALLDPDGPRLEEGIAELRQELASHAGDPASLLLLGMALVEAQRYDEALPALVEATRGEGADAEALYYLGRCRLALGQADAAAATLARALERASADGVDERRVQGIEYQLGLALRRAGRESEAAPHFAAAERLSSELGERSKDRLARYLGEEPEPVEAAHLDRSTLAVSPLASLPAAQREALRAETHRALARAYLNLGVLRLQAGEFARASELLAEGAALDAELAGLQRALGVALFNAGQHAAAIAPLERARAQESAGGGGGGPAGAELSRLLAMSRLETGDFAAAADLLAGDPERASNPSLQYAYALALVRSGRAHEAEQVFAELLRDHAGWPELHVLLGQAHASESSYEAAIAALRRALELSPTVPEAHLTLGTIHLRQGKLAEAEQELRAELRHRAQDRQARYQLATVLELSGRTDEAMTELRAVLDRSPDFADGRYLLGKMLLARGEAERAAVELERAAELAPRDANIRYQLGQAYQKLGRIELAQQAFDAYRELKRAERPESP